MPSADKRQRKKENARMAREAREAAERRSRRLRTARNVGLVVVFFVAVFAVISFITRDNGKKSSSSTSTTVATPTTNASTGVTVSPAAVAKVKCTSTKPATSKKPENLKAPPLTIDPNKTYTATVSTSCGDFNVALDAKADPKGVNNFVYLAKMGFYDGLTWHRVVKDFVIQGGDPAGTGSGGPGYDIVTEVPKDGYPLGTLAWAKGGSAPAGSAGSQFFVVTSDHPSALDQQPYQYGVFGKVTRGIEVAKKIESFAPTTNNGDGAPTQPMYIDKITIAES